MRYLSFCSAFANCRSRNDLGWLGRDSGHNERSTDRAIAVKSAEFPHHRALAEPDNAGEENYRGTLGEIIERCVPLLCWIG